LKHDLISKKKSKNTYAPEEELMVLQVQRQTILVAVVEAVGKPQDEGLISTTASFPLVRNQCLIDQ
jgi:hypothetical protein